VDLQLDNTNVLVSGSSRGIGKAIAERFLREGARVTISARSADTLLAAADELEATTGRRPNPVVADLATTAGAEALVGGAVDAFGGIDVVVGNSGGPPKPLRNFLDTPEDTWTEAYQTQLMSLVRLFRSALPHLRASQRNPTILVVTSATVKEPMPHHAQSTVYRLAVQAMCKQLAAEEGPAGIRVNALGPASVATERLMTVVNVDERVKSIPLGRLGESDELASLAAALASPTMGFVNGVNVQVDGGYVTGLL